MGRERKPDPPVKKSRKRPATSPKAREQQLISLAYDRAEQRLMDGTATGQEIVYFLKLGSEKQEEELEKLRNENAVLIAKAEVLQSAKRVEELYSEAMVAFRAYNGLGTMEDSYGPEQ